MEIFKSATRLVCETAIRTTAREVMEWVECGPLGRGLKCAPLMASIAVARRNGLAEADIETILEEVRREFPEPDCPEYEFSLREVLDPVTLAVRLVGSSGEVCRGIVMTTWDIWDDSEDAEFFEELFQDMRREVMDYKYVQDGYELEWKKIPAEEARAMASDEIYVRYFWIANKVRMTGGDCIVAGSDTRPPETEWTRWTKK